MLFRVLLLWVCCVTSVFADNASDAKRPTHRYQLSLSNALLPSSNSTKGLGELSRELLHIGAYPVDLLNEHYGKSCPFVCMPLTVVYGLLIYPSFLTVPLSIPFHEFGHARGLLALDGNCQAGYHLKLGKHEDLERRLNPYALSHVGGTYYHMLGSLYRNFSGMPFVLPQAARDLIQSFYDGRLDKAAFIQRAQAMVDSPKIDAIPIWAGGFNNQIILSGKIEDFAIERNASHMFDFINLTFNKLMPILYPYEGVPNDLRDADELIQERRIANVKEINFFGQKMQVDNPEAEIRYETVNIYA